MQVGRPVFPLRHSALLSALRLVGVRWGRCWSRVHQRHGRFTGDIPSQWSLGADPCWCHPGGYYVQVLSESVHLYRVPTDDPEGVCVLFHQCRRAVSAPIGSAAAGVLVAAPVGRKGFFGYDESSCADGVSAVSSRDDSPSWDAIDR